MVVVVVVVVVVGLWRRSRTERACDLGQEKIWGWASSLVR